MSEPIVPTSKHLSLVSKAWSMSNVKGYACPLFQQHPRTHLFPNKDMWEYHMLFEHKENDLIAPYDIKAEMIFKSDEYKKIVEQLETETGSKVPDIVMDGLSGSEPKNGMITTNFKQFEDSTEFMAYLSEVSDDIEIVGINRDQFKVYFPEVEKDE